MRIIGIVSLYNPLPSYCENIKKVSSLVDYIILIDDSENCCRHIVESVINNKTSYEWNGGNIGLTKSINKGIKKALSNEADWILILDQDSCLENDIISVYKKYIADNNTDKIALIAPQYNYDRHPRSSKIGNKGIKFANLSGSFINAKILKIVGEYDERFFIDGLDMEWCLRAANKGFKLIECSQAVIKHHPAETRYLNIFGMNIIPYGYSSIERHYYQIRACFLINGIYHSNESFKTMIVKIFKSIFLYGNTKKYLSATFLAYRDYKNKYFKKYKGIYG